MKLDEKHQRVRELYLQELQERIAAPELALSERSAEFIARYNDIGYLVLTCPECCEQCAVIFCPWGETFHTHHDGCPCCASEPDDESDANWKGKHLHTLLQRNSEG